jgi:hypothetical protein
MWANIRPHGFCFDHATPLLHRDAKGTEYHIGYVLLSVKIDLDNVICQKWENFQRSVRPT